MRSSAGLVAAALLVGQGAQAQDSRASPPLPSFPQVYETADLKIRDDGTAPADNPFAGKAGYLPEIFSVGHRSPQGLAVHPTTGELWENEHGPLSGDEVNIVRAGKNYGWPLVTYGKDYDGPAISEYSTRAGYESPFLFWVP